MDGVFWQSMKDDGHDYKQNILSMKSRDVEGIGTEFDHFLIRLFQLNQLQLKGAIKCCRDVISGRNEDSIGNEGVDLSGVRIYGILLKQVMGKRDLKVTHFFMREYQNYTGYLTDWYKNIEFPEEAKEFSAFAVFPDGFSLPFESKRKPQNYNVVQYTKKQMEALGFNEEELLDYAFEE